MSNILYSNDLKPLENIIDTIKTNNFDSFDTYIFDFKESIYYFMKNLSTQMLFYTRKKTLSHFI